MYGAITGDMIGAPYDIYSVADLTKIDVSKYKMFFFLNAFSLTEENRNFINSVLKKDGRTIVFAGPCDYAGEEGFSKERMEKMLGMKTQQLTEPEKLVSYGDVQFGNERAFDETFAVVDENAQTVASFVQSGKVGVAVKHEKDYTVYYSAVGNLHASILQDIARQAGVHIYTDSGIATFINSSFFGIYNTKDDQTVITMQKDGEYKEIFSGKVYKTENRIIKLPTKNQPAQMLVEN